MRILFIGDIVGRHEFPLLIEIEHDVVQGPLGLEVDMGQGPGHRRVNGSHVLAAPEGKIAAATLPLSNITSPGFPGYFKKRLKEGTALLLLDGLEDLPPTH